MLDHSPTVRGERPDGRVRPEAANYFWRWLHRLLRLMRLTASLVRLLTGLKFCFLVAWNYQRKDDKQLQPKGAHYERTHAVPIRGLGGGIRDSVLPAGTGLGWDGEHEV